MDRFDGQHYTHWTNKVKFLLFVLKLNCVLNLELPIILTYMILAKGQQLDQNAISEMEKSMALCRESENLCLSHIKNSLFDILYDMYVLYTDPKEFWKDLSKINKSKDYSLDDMLKHL